MSEIPEDIRKAAEEAWTKADGRIIRLDAIGIIARAILAERQKWSAYLQSVVDPKWQPIETASAGILLLYFPAITGRNANTEMIRVDHFPVAYPRKPSHWMALPSPPEKIESGANAAANSPAPEVSAAATRTTTTEGKSNV